MDSGKWAGNNPWLGLSTYKEGTRLYGRDTEVSTLMDIVCNNSAMVVFGRSGIGKTSLIHAGLSPEIRNRDMTPIYIRFEHNTDCSYIQQIQNAISRELKKEDILGDKVPQMGLWDFFHRNVFYNHEHQQTIPVIIIDQFEETYTLADSDHKHLVTELFEELADLLNNVKPGKVLLYEDGDTKFTKSNVGIGGDDVLTFRIHSKKRLNYIDESNFHLVICLREDYLYYLERNTSKIPSFKVNRFSIQALDRNSAEAVIMLPRPGFFAVNEADNIISKISTLNDDGREEIDPTILSIFLFKYFNSKGNVKTDNIISEFYSDATRNISAASLAFLEDNLITGEGFRHLIPYNDALASGVTKQELEQLIEARILTVEIRKNHKYIEFSHDVICPIASAHRERRKIDEQARKLRRRVLAATGLVFLSFILIGSFLYLHYNLKQSERTLQLSITKNASVKAQIMISQGDVLDAIKLLLNVVPGDSEKEDYLFLPETEKALNSAYDSLTSDYACIAILNHYDDVNTAEFSKDSRLIVTASNDGVCRFWNRESGELVKELKSNCKGMTSATLNNDCNKVIMSFKNGMVMIWDIVTGKELIKLNGHLASVNYACFSPNGQYVLTTSKDKTVRLWDSNTGICLDTIVVHKDDVNSAVFSSDGSRVITASEDGSSVVFEINSKISKEVFSDENVSIEYAEFNYDDSKIAIVTNDAVYIKNVATWKTEWVIKGHDEMITSATFAPKGKMIATSSHDKTVKLWDINDGNIIYTYNGHSNTVSDVVFSPDGKFIISTSNDNEARLWNVPQDSNKRIIDPEMDFLAMIVYNTTGKYIAAASVMGESKIWDAVSLNTIGDFKINERIRGIGFNKENDKVIVTSETGSQYSFNVKTDETTEAEEVNTLYVNEIDNYKEKTPEWVIDGHSDSILFIAPSHDNKYLISASADNTAIVWDANNKCIFRKLKSHSSQVYYAEFSPDDKYVITASTDGTAKLWNVVTGTEVSSRNNKYSPRYNLMFSSTEHHYLVSDGCVIRLYKYFTPKELVNLYVKRFDTVLFTDEEKEYYSLK